GERATSTSTGRSAAPWRALPGATPPCRPPRARSRSGTWRCHSPRPSTTARRPSMSGDPQAAADRRLAARHLAPHPHTRREDDADTLRLIRRHEADLARWFTQRLGYRLHLDADSARLFKTGALGDNRPLRAKSGRPLHQGEYVLLALVLATTVAGPAVISLRDLVDGVRSA